MSFERVTTTAKPGPEPAHDRTSADPAAGSDPAIRLQILATEHSALLASRSLAWNETFGRAGMFLSTLSGAIVALALAAQASDFGPEFTWFALLILPVVLFIGIGTFVRQGGSNYHDAFCVIGMNRIRAAYMELAPEVERYFVTSAHDDFWSVGVSMGVESRAHPGVAEFVASTPTMIAILNSVIAGVIVGLVLAQLPLAATVAVSTPVAVGLGIVGFIAVLVVQLLFARRGIARLLAAYHPRFPRAVD